MPELPEVEVTRRRIARLLIGRTIAEVRTTGPSILFLTKPRMLRARLPGRRVTKLERLGKYLLASLDDGSRLVIHLGMTGQLFAAGAQSPRLLRKTASAAVAPERQSAFAPDLHTHLVLGFADGGPKVFFRDARKFGKVELLDPGETDPRLTKLGKDALLVRGDDLFRAARHRSIPIKTLLLDQSALAGVGNIYADEALFVAGVRPTRRARRLTRTECDRIAHGLGVVLRRAIQTGGSSISDYVQPDGSDGNYQDERRVYAREAEPCPRCGTLIRRCVLGQRSAHFCPHCQH